MNPETEALYRALHDLAYQVDENVPVAQQGRQLNSALAYAFELLEEIRVPGTPKSDAARKWARDNGKEYHDLPLVSVSMDDMRCVPTQNQ
jgi:ubiquinone biosynthesis protein COQ9